MSIIKKMRKQKAVYWAPLGYDDYGQPLLYQFGQNEPVEIDCRWEDKVVQFLDKDGRIQISRAVVYVDRALKVGGALWLGKLLDADIQSPFANDGAWEIRMFQSLPNLRNSETLYTAFL